MCPLDCRPNCIQIGKPAIGGGLVPDAPPDALLGIQAGLVPRQVFQPQPRVSSQKRVHRSALVPSGAVDVEPDRVAAEPTVQVAKRLQETGPVAFGQAEHPAPAEEGCHPAAQVEAGVMLAGRGDAEPFAALAPSPTQAGMEGKPGLIRERDGLVRGERLEFFLASAGTRVPRWPGPGGNCNWLASAGTPAGGAIVALDGP